MWQIDFETVITLRILRWGDYPGLSGWAQCKHKALLKKEAGNSKDKERDVVIEAEKWGP